MSRINQKICFNKLKMSKPPIANQINQLINCKEGKTITQIRRHIEKMKTNIAVMYSIIMTNWEQMRYNMETGF